jgi:hypothetical protein
MQTELVLASQSKLITVTSHTLDLAKSGHGYVRAKLRINHQATQLSIGIYINWLAESVCAYRINIIGYMIACRNGLFVLDVRAQGPREQQRNKWDARHYALSGSRVRNLGASVEAYVVMTREHIFVSHR